MDGRGSQDVVKKQMELDDESGREWMRSGSKPRSESTTPSSSSSPSPPSGYPSSSILPRPSNPPLYDRWPSYILNDNQLKKLAISTTSGTSTPTPTTSTYELPLHDGRTDFALDGGNGGKL
ncbi:hypothetical protein SCHPADRAFT_946223 [Schizopora paradoxa]|uniref:Uncharacterized protein n=1 Tax=Schizopora paradoxa TaxID=27342 RepID=A0A0H2R380_9AGAM|nr:hypothetical protein SCHPADRAFT_946223 [Schizopora paradoxa]